MTGLREKVVKGNEDGVEMHNTCERGTVDQEMRQLLWRNVEFRDKTKTQRMKRVLAMEIKVEDCESRHAKS